MASSQTDDSSQNENEKEVTHEQEKPLSFFQMVGSILSSFFGVQSSEKSKRDFKHGKARQFIAVGILMTIVWYGVISLIVNVVLANR